ncbi:hypothetical protein [Nonomuraea typhae]|uniref:hypothetical protein n=1 Tax=Nonomuraea typhae TaxID=2603600 RepID=UPI0012F77EF1|nr:hypothetical protein [Nonomuraea typhae]
MLVVLAIAALAILACVVLVSLGKGGELTEFPPDVPPLDLPEPGQLTAVDFMALQLPVNLVGYHTQSVDETLRRAASAISERDTRIAVLEQRVSELLAGRLQARQEVYAAPGAGIRTEHEPPAVDRTLTEQGEPAAPADTQPAEQVEAPPVGEGADLQPGDAPPQDGLTGTTAPEDGTAPHADASGQAPVDEPSDRTQPRPGDVLVHKGEPKAEDERP